MNKNHDLNDIKLGPAGGPLVYAWTSQFKLVSVLVIYVPYDWRLGSVMNPVETLALIVLTSN